MPLQLKPFTESKDIKLQAPEYDNHIFESKDDMKRSIKRLDFYVIGKIWVEGMKTVLVGSKVSMIPVIKAAKKEEKPPDPENPKPMGYKELPLYGTPHADYQAFADEKRCNTTNVKIFQQKLLPYVRDSRLYVTRTVSDAVDEIKSQIQSITDTIRAKKQEVLDIARDDTNLTVRYGIVATSALGGFILARKQLFLKRMLATGFAALAAGALCFPSETDEIIRNVCYQSLMGIDRVIISIVYHFYCSIELPPPPSPESKTPCINVPPFVQEKREDACAPKKK